MWMERLKESEKMSAGRKMCSMRCGSMLIHMRMELIILFEVEHDRTSQSV